MTLIKWILLLMVFAAPLLAVDSTVFNTQATFDIAFGDAGSGGNDNYGAAASYNLDHNFSSSRIFIRITTLDDVLGATSAGLDYDSVIIYMKTSSNSLDDNGEQLLVTGCPVTQLWTEGIGPVSADDLTFNRWTTDEDWTTPGGDYGSAFSNFGATGTMLINFNTADEEYKAYYVDTAAFRAMVEDDNTKGWSYVATHETGSPNDPFAVHTDDAGSAAQRPYLVAYHTTKAGAAAYTPVMIIGE